MNKTFAHDLIGTRVRNFTLLEFDFGHDEQ